MGGTTSKGPQLAPYGKGGKNRKVAKFYTMGAPIGEAGAYGYAVRAVNKETKEEVAIKVVEKKNLSMDDLKAEIGLMTRLDHPNIIKGKDVFEDKKKVYLVMEICKGGELFDRIVQEQKVNKGRGAYCERDAANILRQLFSGLEYMHARNIAHCDLKPSNFLFESEAPDANLKIIDFGTCFFSRPVEVPDMFRKLFAPDQCTPPVLSFLQVCPNSPTRTKSLQKSKVQSFPLLVGVGPCARTSSPGNCRVCLILQVPQNIWPPKFLKNNTRTTATCGAWAL